MDARAGMTKRKSACQLLEMNTPDAACQGMDRVAGTAFS